MKNEIWNLNFNPLYPYSGWASGNYIPIRNLSGKNVNMVPKNAVGAKVEKTVGGTVLNNNTYYYSRFFDSNIEDGKQYKASVYCYVSGDFNGDWVRIFSHDSTHTISNSYYDLTKKEVWQHLQFVLDGDTGKLFIAFNFCKLNSHSFDSLIGNVIFAYPELNIIKLETKRISSIFSTSSKIKNRYYASIFPVSLFKSRVLQNDSLTLKPTFQIKMGNDRFSGPRLDRWRYALYFYKYEYDLKQKIIGGGFEYTRKFAKQFNVPDGYDYPHSPFLSVLLYSGVVGLMVYLWVLLKVFYLYWIYRKKFLTLFLCFLATLFYCLFSANNPFDPAVMSLFMVIPFFIHSVHKRDNKNKIGYNDTNEDKLTESYEDITN